MCNEMNVKNVKELWAKRKFSILCKCGHEQVNHIVVERTDTERGYWGRCVRCSCKKFEKISIIDRMKLLFKDD